MSSSATSRQPEPKENLGIAADRVFSFEFFEKLAKSGLLLVAFVYASGLIVTNVYLAEMGVSDFSSLRPKYILTGTWTLLLTFAAILPVLFPGFQWLQERKTSIFRFSLRSILSQTLGGLLLGALIYLLLSMFLSGHIWRPHFSRATLGALLAVNFYTLMITLVIDAVRRKIILPLFGYLFYGIMMLIMSVGWARDVISPIYTEIPEGLGGGKPIRAELILNANGVVFWKQTGISSAEKTYGTGTIQILYQNEHEFVVRVFFKDGTQNKEKVVILSKSLVDGAIVQH